MTDQQANKIHTREELESVAPIDYTIGNATPTDIFYYFFNDPKQTDGIKITPTDCNCGIKIDPNLPTKFFLHGYQTDHTSPWYSIYKTNYFNRGPHNIFYVNYHKAGSLNFKISAANIYSLGEFIADFIITLQISPENIHLIGHSLGSHLSGFIGQFYHKKTNKKIARITGTDPGFPGFENQKDESMRLNKNDANFVDVIHTDINYFGYRSPLGHVDFYPNGGKNQPGCDFKTDYNASHARSTLFFGESIVTKVMAQKAIYCNGEVEPDCCDVQETIFGDQVPNTARGVYYLKTNASPPFLPYISN